MKRRKRKEKNVMYQIAMLMMTCILAVLLYLINDVKQIVSVDQLKNIKLSTITQFLFWENILFDQEEAVVSTSNYTLLKDHLYSNGGNVVSAVLDGVIVKVDNDEIIQLCDNGVSIVYSNIESVEVQKEDRIKANDPLGTMKENVEMHFYKDEKEISLEEAMAIK